jgi:hypothetical protein
MIRGGRSGGTNQGSNPTRGVTLTYYIADDEEGPLNIEILDLAGNVLRTYSSEESEFDRCITSFHDERTSFEVKHPTMKQGVNQWTWDMRQGGLSCIEDLILYAGFNGATVMPGNYQLLVSVGDAQSIASVTLLPDPRSDAAPADYEFLATKLVEVTDLLNELVDDLSAARKTRSEIATLLEDFPNVEGLQIAGEAAIDRITTWENTVTQTQYGTYEDEDSMPPMLDVHVRHVLDVMDAAGKDSTIRAVMQGVDPSGCQVYSFKKPTRLELDHDFLWRTSIRLPERGRIGIFNRSQYEEVLAVRVHPQILASQKQIGRASCRERV